jgi:hypothetical protein
LRQVYPHFNIFGSTDNLVFFRSGSERWRIFPYFGWLKLGQKRYFSVSGKWLEKLSAKSGGCGVFFKNGTKESILHNLKL